MTLGYSRNQRAGLIAALVVLVVTAATVRASGGALFGALLGMLIVFGNQVRLLPAGVEIRVGFRRIRVPWTDVAQVERTTRFGTERIVLRLHDGRSRWLPVPYSGWVFKNSRMDEHTAAVESAWRAGLAQAG